VSPQWSLSLRFSHQNPIHTSSSPICATCPARLILLNFITCTIASERYRSIKLPCYLVPLRRKYSHPYNTTDKIIVLYILIFKFLDSKLEDKRFTPNDSNHSLTSIHS
jgi:hypothetical protein